MHSVFSKSDKSGPTRRLFFNQVRDKFEGWRAGKACQVASRGHMNDDEFFARFKNLYEIYINRFHKRIESAKQPEVDDYWKGWNAALDWAHRIVSGDKSAD